MSVEGTRWVERFAEAAGVPAPGPEEVELLLGLAGVAAHASERTAAPLTTWLAGRAGMAPEQAHALATRLAEELARPAEEPGAQAATDGTGGRAAGPEGERRPPR